MSEAMVKVVKNSVKKQVDKYGRDWDKYLQSTAFAIRSSINNSTKFAPAELLLGENLMRPIDLSVDEPNDQRSFPNRQANEFASMLSKRIEESSRIVNNNLEISRRNMKSIYDKKNTSHEFKEGDQVMLWWPYKVKGISRAFQPKWKGPYEISRLIGPTNCTITYDNGQPKNVHLNQLKHVEARNQHSDELPINKEMTNSPPVETVGDLFDDLFDEFSDDHNAPNHNEDDTWCGLSDQNVVGSRTRSGIGRVGDG
jgi:hypothetical protein